MRPMHPINSLSLRAQRSNPPPGPCRFPRSRALARPAAWWLVAFIALAWLLAAPPSLAQGSGVIEGQVVNGTPGGPAIGQGVAVTLRAFENGTEVDVQEAVTGADGTFRFEDLDTDPALEYWLEAVYQDVTYADQTPYTFGDGEDTLSATVDVYETTADDSAVRVSSVHMIAESFGQALRVTEVHLLSNAGDRAFAGEPAEGGAPSTVFIPLPEGAVAISFGEGMEEGRFVQVPGSPEHPGGGLQDTVPVPPGNETSMVYFSYHLMVAGDSLPVEREFAYPVDSLNVFVVQPGLDLASTQLEMVSVESIQGRQYAIYAIDDLPAGEKLAMDLLPVAGAETATPPRPGTQSVSATSGEPPSGTQGALRWIGLLLSLAAVMAAFVYPALARRALPARAPTADLAGHPHSRALVAELAVLEDAYAAGTVDDDEYERQRARLYDALRQQHP